MSFNLVWVHAIKTYIDEANGKVIPCTMVLAALGFLQMLLMESAATQLGTTCSRYTLSSIHVSESWTAAVPAAEQQLCSSCGSMLSSSLATAGHKNIPIIWCGKAVIYATLKWSAGWRVHSSGNLQGLKAQSAIKNMRQGYPPVCPPRKYVSYHIWACRYHSSPWEGYGVPEASWFTEYVAEKGVQGAG